MTGAISLESVAGRLGTQLTSSLGTSCECKEALHFEGLDRVTNRSSAFGEAPLLEATGRLECRELTTQERLSARTLEIAASQVGVMEQPLGSDRGPQVDLYLASVELGPGYFWCMAFVHWCFCEAADALGVENPFPRTANCIEAWRRTALRRRLSRNAALDDPSLVRPGMVFILDKGNGSGHTGFVKETSNLTLTTIEGNTNPKGGGRGIGVFELSRRHISDADLVGFLDFTRL